MKCTLMCIWQPNGMSPLAMAEWIEIWEKEGLNVIDAGLR